MTNLANYAQNIMLNWMNSTATPSTRPTTWGIALATGAPSSTSASEIATGSGYIRQTGLFATATGSTQTMSAAITFGPFSSAQSITGLVIFDTMANTIGNMLWYGNLATARTVGIGDSLVIASGSLVLTLS